MKNKLIFWIIFTIRRRIVIKGKADEISAKIMTIKVKRMKYLQKLGAQRQRLRPVFCNLLQTELQENLNLFNVYNVKIFNVCIGQL